MRLHAAKFALVSGIVVTAIASTGQAQLVNQTSKPANNVLAHALAVETGSASPRAKEARLSSGAIYAALAATGVLDARADANGALGAQWLPGKGSGTQGCSNTFQGNGSKNIRVNQDCSLRRQAESAITINPVDPNNIIVGQNDSRLGFNKCGYDFSFDGGSTWGDQVPPFYQFLNGDGVTFDACSDPTATFDANGNAYVGGVLFEIFYADSAFVVAKSNAGIGGAFYHSPQPIPFQTYRDVPLGVVANDNNPNIFNDKEFIVADAGAASPKKNNVYATWTRFNGATGAGVGGDSPIYFSQSLDGGATWSPGVEISGASAACTVFSGEANPNACDQDQGSDPFVGADGTIYVTFGNGNTPTAGVNQVMIVSCPSTNICSNSASWTAPVKVGDLFDFQPFGPNAVTGCPGGRQCLPPNGYRLDDFVEISGSVDSSGRLYVTWADGRNIAANCQGSAATATPPCDNDVFYAFSTNGGATWSPAIKLTPAGSAQWMPWSAAAADGSTLFVAYYDRSYGNCEQTGCNDITLARITNPASASPKVSYQRITTASMPNLVVANNPIEAGFLGDYMYLAIDAKGFANIVWSDTRGLGGTVEEDIYFARVPGNPQNGH
jgi:hypothetical protein